MHSVPSSPQAYCLTLLKFISLFGHPFLEWPSTIAWIMFLSPIFINISCIILCCFSVCLQHTVLLRDVLAGFPSLFYHTYLKKLTHRYKGQNRSHYFFNGVPDMSVMLSAWQTIPTVPLKADHFCSVFNSINTTFLFLFLLSLPKDWQLYII